MAKIVVTGGAGFIGSNLIQALNNEGITEILVVDHLDLELKKKNLDSLKYNDYLDRDEFLPWLDKEERGGVETIFHLGAATDTREKDLEFLIRNNTLYSKRIFDFCARNKTRLIYASSAATYGAGEKGYSDLERNLKPLNYYGYSKYLFDELVREAEIKPKQLVGLKFFNVYGPNEYHKGAMASIVSKCLSEIIETGKFTVFKSRRADVKDGEQKRDCIYVKDVVRAMLFFLKKPNLSGIFNVGTGKARSFLDLAYAVFNTLKLKPKIDFVEMPPEIKDQYQYFTQADLSSLRAVGYKERFFELEEGIKDYVENYLSKEK